MKLRFILLWVFLVGGLGLSACGFLSNSADSSFHHGFGSGFAFRGLPNVGSECSGLWDIYREPGDEKRSWIEGCKSGMSQSR